MKKNQDKNRDKIKGYLEKNPGFPIVQILVLDGLIIPLILIALKSFSSYWAVSIPITVLLIAMWLISRRRSSKTSDTEFDTLFWNDMQELKLAAREKLLLLEEDEVSEPQEIWSQLKPIKKKSLSILKNFDEPTFQNAFAGEKKGEDGLLRFSPINVAIIFFTEHKLLSYQCVFDLTTGNKLNYSTRKYYYDEIVSIQTESDSYTFGKVGWFNKFIRRMTSNLISPFDVLKKQMNLSERFTITTKGGNFLTVKLPGGKVLGDKSTESEASRTDLAVRSVEKMVDQRKLN